MTRAPQAVLFADISGSVSIYDARGDTVGFHLSSGCLRLLRAQVEKHGGRVIKEMGDGMLALHDDAAGSIHAACGMITAMRDPDSDIGKELMQVHVGINFGPVVHDRNDIFGDTVNVAARLLGRAKPDEILMTEAVFAALPGEMQALAQSIDLLSIRGRARPVKVYRYLWADEADTEQTTAGSAGVGEQAALVRLEVEWEGALIIVDRAYPKVRIGRASQNDLVVKHDKVSKSHAEISFRQNRFVLADKSTNGTFLSPQDSVSLRIHREEVTLLGNGVIILGGKSGPQLVYRMVMG